MAAELKIKYVVDSIEGNSLSTTVTGEENGWVEYCNQRGQLFYADAVSEEFYKKCRQQAIDTIVKHALVSDKKHLGFIHHLSTVLLDHEFVLPVFGVMPADSDELKITTGLTRIIAGIMNGWTAQELKTVVHAPKEQTVTHLVSAKPLTSTKDFVKIYDLDDIDYEISMSDNVNADMSEFQFDRSVLKYSIYDKKDQALPHTQTGTGIVTFWDRHVKQEKILINIRCTPDVEKLIQPSKIFNYNIIHEKSDEWQWSYGKILGAYRKSETLMNWEESRIHLWLYDVTEPIYLELLLPWVTGQHTACHTKNKKALFFDTSNDVTSIQIIGDWVK
jgi:hypothetical protein